MITKKLFTPKCQHVDRDLVFKEDLSNFYLDFVDWLTEYNNAKSEVENKQSIFLDYNNKAAHIDGNLNTCPNKKEDENIANYNNFDSICDSKVERYKDSTKIKKDNHNKDSEIFLYNSNVPAQQILYKHPNSPPAKMKCRRKISQSILKTLNYTIFKYYWKEKKMTLLHFCKSKEENFKEYYEILFGEIQSFLVENNLYRKKGFDNNHLLIQILSIYTLYSLYFTQTTDFFYQINIIPEFLIKFNEIIKNLIKKKLNLLSREICLMIHRLHKAEAFSIGVLPGLKTIILNKYGLPCEQKTNTYNDYMDINNNYKNLFIKDDYSQIHNLIDQYKSIKYNSVNMIKSCFADMDLDKDTYCDYINSKNKLVECSKNDLAFLKIDEKDLEKKMSNIDLQFNIFDNFI